MIIQFNRYYPLTSYPDISLLSGRDFAVYIYFFIDFHLIFCYKKKEEIQKKVNVPLQ